MNFPSRAEYERLIYGILNEHPEVASSTLRLFSTSALTATVQGSLNLRNGLKLHIVEVVDFKAEQIRHYSYSVFRGEEKIRWYDSQPHPENPDLTTTFPHHYHEEPDIKHNRRPAPGMSHQAPNISTLIIDCLALGISASKMKTPKGQQGFTLIEVLVAITLLSVGILAAGTMQISSLGGNNLSIRVTESSIMASDRIEQLLALPFDDPLLAATNNRTADALDDIANPDHSEDLGAGFMVFWNVADEYPVENCKKVRVLVRREDRGAIEKVISVDFIKVRH